MEVPVEWTHYLGAQQSYLLYHPTLYLRYQHDYHWKFSLYSGLDRQAGQALDLCPYLPSAPPPRGSSTPNIKTR